MMLSRLDIHKRSGLSPEVCDLLHRHARAVVCEPDMLVIGPDRAADGVVLLLSGRVCLYDLGHRVRACRISAGHCRGVVNTCVITPGTESTCAVAETHVEAFDIPHDTLAAMMTRSGSFRALIFEACSNRIAELFQGTQAHTSPSKSQEASFNSRLSQIGDVIH